MKTKFTQFYGKMKSRDYFNALVQKASISASNTHFASSNRAFSMFTRENNRNLRKENRTSV